MKEIKVGDFIRTKEGYVGKILRLGDEFSYDCIFGSGDCKYAVSFHGIVKHSPNIIDLIEVGDYVNGYKVLEKIKSNIRENGIHILIFRTHSSETWETFFEDEIESIVTKEQFESMKYEVNHASNIT